jgi:hypothetical protein
MPGLFEKFDPITADFADGGRHPSHRLLPGRTTPFIRKYFT